MTRVLLRPVAVRVGPTTQRPSRPYPPGGARRTTWAARSYYGNTKRTAFLEFIMFYDGLELVGRRVRKEGGGFYDNNKRRSLLWFLDLPRMTEQPLELALFLSDKDGKDRQLLEEHDCRVRHSPEVAGTPEMYQSYVRASRGEFGCAKPSCIRFQNAWVSDRTVCYLASGKPVVVQDTGPSSFLPNGSGMFRFSTAEEASAAIEAVNADYAGHSRAAREIAESFFDARDIAGRILEAALP